MSERNEIQTIFDEFGKANFGTKRSSSWYLGSDETITVLNLQRSSYGPRYYVNIAIWLLAAGPTTAPKPHQCHIQTRLERLVPPSLEKRLNALLDLDCHIEPGVRREELLALLGKHLRPILEVSTTSEGLRSDQGMQFLRASLINGEGQRLLAAT